MERGTKVGAYDPQATASARELLPPDVDFAETAEETAVGAHALILLTEWGDIVRSDWAAIAGRMLPPRFVFDGRNALDAGAMLRLGFDYAGIGRGDIRWVDSATIMHPIVGTAFFLWLMAVGTMLSTGRVERHFVDKYVVVSR